LVAGGAALIFESLFISAATLLHFENGVHCVKNPITLLQGALLPAAQSEVKQNALCCWLDTLHVRESTTIARPKLGP
jgi:hypothetical protein